MNQLRHGSGSPNPTENAEGEIPDRQGTPKVEGVSGFHGILSPDNEQTVQENSHQRKDWVVSHPMKDWNRVVELFESMTKKRKDMRWCDVEWIASIIFFVRMLN